MKKGILFFCIISALTISFSGCKLFNSNDDSKESSNSGSPSKNEDSDNEKNNLKKGMATKILGKKCSLVTIAKEKKNTNKTSCKLDVDLDDKKEAISIEIKKTNNDIEEVYLNIDDKKQKLENLDSFSLNINAITLDGDNIYLVVGGSASEENNSYNFFSYKDKKIVSQGCIVPDNHIDNKKFKNTPIIFNKDGSILTTKRSDLIQTDPIEVTYKADEDGAIKIDEKGIYNFTQNNDINLLKEISVSDKVGKKETKKIKPQTIKIKKVTSTKVDFTSKEFDTQKDLNTCYVYIVAKDGSKGWLHCSKEITDSRYAETRNKLYFDNIIMYG